MTKEEYNAAIANAYMENQTLKFYQDTMNQLAGYRRKMDHFHPYNKEELPSAIKVLQSKINSFKPWHERPFWQAVITVALTLISGYLIYLFGWN